MLDDRDIWRSANTLIEHCGDAAAFKAAQRADELLERGDMEGPAVWRRILQAVEDLQSLEPGGAAH